MATHPHAPVRPPPAPLFERRIRFDWPELIGLPLLAVLPLLALCGLFDEQRALVAARQHGLLVKVDYPSRLRFEHDSALDVVIRNERATPISNVRLVMDRAFLAHFDRLHFEPPSGTLHADRWELALPTIAPGDARHVRIEVRPAHPGLHHGLFALEAPDGTRLPVVVRTLIWP